MLKYRINRMVEKCIIWIAWHTPRRIAYWCAIRLGVHATTGQWSNQEVPALTMPDMLQRWEKP